MNRIRILLIISTLALCMTGAAGQELPTATPEQVGLSAERLDRITKTMEADVAARRVPGALAMVIRRGKVAYLESRGMADREAGSPMRDDTIFRIYSMTKPITSVAVMMLYEEGRIRMKDPVSKHIPELSGLKVLVGKPNGTHVLEKAKREMTVQDLLRHTSGLTYGLFAKSAVDQMYQDAGILSEKTVAEMVTELAKIPLKHHPGTRWEYSVATDVLGRLVEVVSGMSFDEYLRQRILEPLGMKDTGFYVPESKMDRFAQLYQPDENGGIAPSKPRSSRRFMKKGKYLSGGGGLVSTAADYARFCQMILNGGELDGVRILGPKTVDFMTVDHVAGIAQTPLLANRGFGLGFSITTSLPASGIAGSLGDASWGGWAGTRFWIDPEEEIIGIYMVQIGPHNGLHFGETFKALTYQAVVE